MRHVFRSSLLAVLMSTVAFAEPQVVKVATVAPDNTPWADHLKSLKEKIDKNSSGRLKLKAYLGGGLGDETTTASETKRGAIQIWGGSTGALATLVPELAMFELPYFFRNEQEADYIIDEILFDDFNKLLEKRGFKVLFWAENGYRSFGTTFGPVKSPAALKGKKMRSQESDVHLEMYRAFGASPVPISVTEVLPALQTKLVDGFDNTPLFTFAASWYQGVKHYTLTEAIYQPGLVVANKEWFDKLHPDDQKLFLTDQKATAARGRKSVRELAPFLIENFKNAGIEVHTVSDAEKAEYSKLAEPTHEKWVKGQGKLAAPLFKKAKTALVAYRAGKK